MKYTRDLKKYILKKYPKLSADKIEIVKIGWQIWIFLVTKENKLIKEKIIRGTLESHTTMQVLKDNLDDRIKKMLTKYGYA